MSQFLVESAGAVLAVRQSRDDGEPLLLLHGGPGVPDYMQAATAPMLPGFRCISFDQRGTGESACRDGRYDLAAYREHPDALKGAPGYDGPVLVLYGADDIFADGTEIVRRRFPHATQVTLQDSGHVHWLQNPSGYADALGGFYARPLLGCLGCGAPEFRDGWPELTDLGP